jgi:hypothetical protein
MKTPGCMWDCLRICGFFEPKADGQAGKRKKKKKKGAQTSSNSQEGRAGEKKKKMEKVKLDSHTRDDSELHSNAHTTPVGSYAHLAIIKKTTKPSRESTRRNQNQKSEVRCGMAKNKDPDPDPVIASRGDAVLRASDGERLASRGSWLWDSAIAFATAGVEGSAAIVGGAALFIYYYYYYYYFFFFDESMCCSF